MQKEYTQTQLDKLMETLEQEFSVALAKREETLAKSETGESAAPSVDGSVVLAKAEDEKPAEAKDDKAEDKKEESSEAPAAAAKEAPKADEAPAKEEGKEEAPAAQAKDAEAPAAPAEGADNCDYDDEDMDHMHKMYASMSKGELRAHHDAIKKTLDGMGMAKCGEAAPAEAPMAKSEETSIEVKPEVVAAQPNPEVELLKSEVSAKDAKISELQKNLEVATEFLTKLFSKKTAPAGKAITNLEVIQKSEIVEEEKPLTKGEVTQRLIKKAADPSLSKSDRELINAYYLSGASINKISHLLK